MQGRGIGRRLALSAVLASALGGCARVRPEADERADSTAAGTAAGGFVFLAIASPIHTEVLLAWPAEEALPPPFPRPGFLGVSFGSRDFFAADAPDSLDLLRAFVPGPAAILVAARQGPPTHAVAITVAPDGRRRLARAVAANLARDERGRPMLVAPPSSGGAYFHAVPPYSLAYTCNTWSLDLLAAAGVPVSATGVITPRIAMAVARAAASRSAARSAP